MSTVTAPALANSGGLSAYLAQQSSTIAASSSTSSSSSSSGSSFASIAGNETTFLQILTTQLQNQDPTAATDTNQFTEELVQFTQAEEQINTNNELTQLINLTKNSSGVNAALNYIGAYVQVPSSSQLPLQNSSAELTYTLPSAAQKVSIAVQDSSGNTVANLTGTTASGANYVSWDGKESDGSTVAPDGTYTFSITALDASGKALTPANVGVFGLATSVTSNSDGTTNLTLSTGMSVATSTVQGVYPSSSLPKATLGDSAGASS